MTKINCFVPTCKNTSETTPAKLFFNVPKGPDRKKWLKVARKNHKTSITFNTRMVCCEDHFDIENDMENYIKWKLVGGIKKLRQGVLPHKFKWTEKSVTERSAVEKRRLREFYERVLSPKIHHEDLQVKPVEFITVVEEVQEDPIKVAEPEVEPKKTFKNRSVQCCIKLKRSVRSVRTNTDDSYRIAMETKIEQQRRKIKSLEKKLEKLENVHVEPELTPSENEGDFEGGSSDEYCPDIEIKSSTKLIKTRSELKALKPKVS